MTAMAAEIRKGRKYDQVLAGARQVFLTDGFEGASVDQIARVSEVSKATLYSYFPDKKLLFMEVASVECQRQADQAMSDIDLARPPREVLGQVGRHYLGFILSDFGQRIFRICVAESDRFPELGRKFYASGPELFRERMGNYLYQAQERGEVRIGDFNLASDQFAELCKADLWPRMIFGVLDQASPQTISRVIDGAVETFMARYGVC